jgi:hypothetical protein
VTFGRDDFQRLILCLIVPTLTSSFDSVFDIVVENSLNRSKRITRSPIYFSECYYKLTTFKMPRNTTGGSGHKARSNSEGNTTKKNRQMLESYIDDITNDGFCEDVHVSRVTKKLGDGRVDATYFEGDRVFNIQATIKGAFRGRGKSQAFVDIGSIVLVASTGLVGSMAYEVIAVVPALGNPIRKKFESVVSLERLISGVAVNGIPETGFEFDHDSDEGVDVDDI